MRRSDVQEGEQVPVDVGFFLPGIEDCRLQLPGSQGGLKCVTVHHRSAGRIDEDALFSHSREAPCIE